MHCINIPQMQGNLGSFSRMDSEKDKRLFLSYILL